MSDTLNREKVLEYIQKYWSKSETGYNPAFPEYEFQDCTNFVSQCWNYSGFDMTILWHSYAASKSLTNRAWAAVEDFYQYMTETSTEYTSDKRPLAFVQWSSDGVNIGDIIQFYNEKEGWHHSAIISGFDPIYGITYAAHSTDHLRKPLSDVYPHQETLIRFIRPLRVQ